MKPESEVQNEQRLEIAKLGGKAYRNNSGAYDPVHPPSPGTRWGIGNDSHKINKVRKSSDLICILPVVITPAMVGHTLGVFMADEVKREGWHYTNSPEEVAQQSFLDIINSTGGIGFFSQSVLDFKNAIHAFYARFK